MQVVLIEFENEAERFLRRTQGGWSIVDGRIIALTPAVRAYLSAQDIPHDTTLADFGTESHRGVLIQLEKMCRLFKEELAVPAGFEARQTMKDSVIFHARMFLAHLMKKIEILHNVSTRLNVDSWTAFRYRRPVRIGGDPNILPDERHAGEITREFARQRGQPCEEIFDVALPTPPADRPLESNLMNAVIGRMYLHLFGQISRRPVGLFSNFGYGLGTLAGEISERNPDATWFWIDTEPKSGGWIELKKCLKRMQRVVAGNEKGPFAIPLHHVRAAVGPPKGALTVLVGELEERCRHLIETHRSVFMHRGISLEHWLMDKLTRDILPFQAYNQLSALAIRALIRQARPRLVLSQVSADAYCALGEICSESGVPAILISHGTSVPSEQIESRIEQDHISRRLIDSTYPFVALQSPWAARFAKEMRVKSQPVKTGPLIWARIHRRSGNHRHSIIEGIPEDARIVVHASTPRPRQAHHFFICETHDEYIQNISDVLEAVEQIEHCVLVVRFRPQPPVCSLDHLVRILPKSKRLFFAVEQKFSEVLAAADVMISFYSTTIEEAINNGVPVLLYGCGGRYCHLPAERIEPMKSPSPSAAYFAPDRSLLKPALENILRIHGGQRLTGEMKQPHCFEPSEITEFSEWSGRRLACGER